MSRVATAPGHAREYETIYILRPNTEREKADDVAGKLGEAIKSTDAMLTGVELWGQRRLAYPIRKHHRGIYVYLKYLGQGATVAEIERQLRLADSVIRFQTVQTANDVPVGGAHKADLAALAYEVPFEPDEPELSVERDLGLDAASLERRRREEHELDEMDELGEDEAGRGAAGADGAESDRAAEEK